MIKIEGIDLPIDPIQYSWETLKVAADFYPAYIKQGGTIKFHGYLIEVVKECQRLNQSMWGMPYYNFINYFIRKTGMKEFNKLATRMALYTSGKKKEKK